MGRGTKQGLAGFKTLLLFFFQVTLIFAFSFGPKKNCYKWWTVLAHANFNVGSIFLVSIHVSPSWSLNLYLYFFGRLSPVSIFYFCFRSNRVRLLFFSFTKLTISIYKIFYYLFFWGGVNFKKFSNHNYWRRGSREITYFWIYSENICNYFHRM